jgi:hypothetical protein
MMSIRQQKSYDAALENALKTCQPAREFVRMYPDSIRWFEYYLPGSGSTALHLRAALHDRYVFSVRVPLTLDPQRERVATRGAPELYLLEVSSISPDGREMRYNTAFHRQLTPEDWQRLVAGGGDFSALDIELKTDTPVAGFRRMWSENPYAL